MLNLLPQEERKKLISEYKIRLSIVITTFVCLILFIAIVGLFPSYASKKTEMEELLNQKNAADQQNSVESLKQADTLVSSNKVLAGYLEGRITSLRAASPVTAVLKDIFSKKTSSINLIGIDISEKLVTVKGVAATRAALIVFHNDLRKVPMFKNASLPISDIAKSTDANFSIEIVLP